MHGRHPTRKKPGDATFDPKWSGVSYAPHARGKHCPTDGTLLHRESGALYCPTCDDYVRAKEDGGKPK